LRIFKNAWFGRFARKENITDQVLWEAIERAERGLIDADLGGGVIKQRIARPGAGKSKGYRSIVLYRRGEKAFFVYGFAKSEIANLRDDEEIQFKKAANVIFSLTDSQIDQLIENGQFDEVKNHG
jgi:hypothetical protein